MLSPDKQKLLDFYNEGLTLYKLRKWDDAIKHFEMALAVDPKDGPSKLYFDRAHEFKANPPSDDWDGVFVMKTK